MYERMYYSAYDGQIPDGEENYQQMIPYQYMDPNLYYQQAPVSVPMYYGQDPNQFIQQPYPYPVQFQQQPYQQMVYSYPENYQTEEQDTNKTNRFLAHFQTKEGQYDFDKIFSTAGQFIGIVRQVTPMVTQLGTLVRVLRP